MFDAERQITGPDSVHRLGLTVTDIQAALMWGEDKTQKIFFFKSGNYWRFNLLENRIDTTHARSMRDWRGIPNDIDAAFQDRYGKALFRACIHIVICGQQNFADITLIYIIEYKYESNVLLFPLQALHTS